MITTTKLILRLDGDPSVGIFPCSWEISGDFQFDNEQDFKDFKTELTAAWELVCGERVYISTIEEVNNSEPLNYNPYLDAI